MIYLYGLDLHFPIISSTDHLVFILVSHLYISFGEVSFKSLYILKLGYCYVIIIVIEYSVVGGSLHILDLPFIVENIFFYYQGCPFTLLTLPLPYRRFFNITPLV